jgi:hypothetical protein
MVDALGLCPTDRDHPIDNPFEFFSVLNPNFIPEFAVGSLGKWATFWGLKNSGWLNPLLVDALGSGLAVAAIPLYEIAVGSIWPTYS